MHKALWTVLCVATLATSAKADDFCGWRPRDIPDPSAIRGTSLTLSDERSTFGIYNDCITIERTQFGSELNFGIVNRFSKDMAGGSGYVLIKSIRTFSNTPPIRFSLSRGRGWFVPGPSNAPLTAEELNRIPYRSTIAAWNAAHAVADSPAALANQLHILWHAYADHQETVASSTFPEFWRIDGNPDEAHTVITNYLIHFDLNTGDRVKMVPFQVGLQPQVKQFEIHIMGDPDALSGDYRFIVK